MGSRSTGALGVVGVAIGAVPETLELLRKCIWNSSLVSVPLFIFQFALVLHKLAGIFKAGNNTAAASWLDSDDERAHVRSMWERVLSIQGLYRVYCRATTFDRRSCDDSSHALLSARIQLRPSPLQVRMGSRQLKTFYLDVSRRTPNSCEYPFADSLSRCNICIYIYIYICIRRHIIL